MTPKIMQTDDGIQVELDYSEDGQAPKPASEGNPGGVGLAHDILKGKYDHLPLDELTALADGVFELDESHGDLVAQVDDYLTRLSAKIGGADLALGPEDL
jgi:hypothetical protein